jgi:hypothetical protein
MGEEGAAADEILVSCGVDSGVSLSDESLKE